MIIESRNEKKLESNDGGKNHPRLGKLSFQWKSEYDNYDMKEQLIYMNGHLKAPFFPESFRKPIDVVIALDRSISMTRDKLNLCLKTIEFFIEELSPQDRLSIISYSEEARTDMKLTRMDTTGKMALMRTLTKVQAESNTNISAGLLQGIQEIQNNTRNDGGPPNSVKSILLLTDGHATRGVQTTGGMVQMVKDNLQDDVSLFTFGYGSDHNAEMLRQVSEAGRGVYYFVEDLDGVTLAFANCLGGLLSVVAQNIKLKIRVVDGCEIVSVKTKREVSSISPEEYEVDVGDLYGEEERDFLLLVKLPAMKEGMEILHNITSELAYVDIVSSTLAREEHCMSIKRNKLVKSDRIGNSHVLTQKNRILTAEALEKATELSIKGCFDDSRSRLQDTIDELRMTECLITGEERETNDHLIQDLQSCVMNLNRTRNEYSIYKFNSFFQLHYFQRSNNCDSSTKDCAGPSLRARGLNRQDAVKFDFADLHFESRRDSGFGPDSDSSAETYVLASKTPSYRTASKSFMMQKAFRFVQKT